MSSRLLSGQSESIESSAGSEATKHHGLVRYISWGGAVSLSFRPGLSNTKAKCIVTCFLDDKE
jgi:hypothetical protein